MFNVFIIRLGYLEGALFNYQICVFKGRPTSLRPLSSKQAGTLESDQTLTAYRRWRHGIGLPALSIQEYIQTCNVWLCV